MIEFILSPTRNISYLGLSPVRNITKLDAPGFSLCFHLNESHHTGVVVERANLTEVKRLSEEQRYYLCAWCGEKSRGTIPGGCKGIPNKLGR